MKTLVAFVFASLLAPAAMAQSGQPATYTVQAPKEPKALPLYLELAPKSGTTENWAKAEGRDDITLVRNVTHPTLTPFLPKRGKATGAAVVIAPGGAFYLLAIEHEGWRVAQRLADRGIAAFVLKYRVMPTPLDEKEAQAFIGRKVAESMTDPSKAPDLHYAESTEDALAALQMVRTNAKKWGVDPSKVGIIGFSAGAMTAMNAVLSAKQGEGPDFVGYVYGPQAAVDVPATAPPLFNAIALDDPLFPSMGFPVAQSWLDAKRPVEIHAYERGGHGFGGSGLPGTTTTLLLDEFVAWLSMHGFLGQPVKQ